jgi:hypothetical protein
MATSPKKTSSRKPAARPSRAAKRQSSPKDTLARLRVGDDLELEGGAMVRVVARTPGGHPIVAQVNGSTDAVYAKAPSHPYPDAAATLTRNSVVFDSLHSIGRRVDEAWNAIEELEKAAASILVPEPPAAAGDSASSTNPVPAESPAVNLMHELSLGLERLTNRINNITGRVQA